MSDKSSQRTCLFTFVAGRNCQKCDTYSSWELSWLVGEARVEWLGGVFSFDIQLWVHPSLAESFRKPRIAEEKHPTILYIQNHPPLQYCQKNKHINNKNSIFLPLWSYFHTIKNGKKKRWTFTGRGERLLVLTLRGKLWMLGISGNVVE